MKKLTKIKFITVLLGLLFVCGQVFAAKNEKDNTEYSGVYNDRQLIPNRMAELCQKNAEDMVKNPSGLVDCINTLAMKRRSTTAETARDGLKELNEVKAEQIIKTMTLATIKGAEIAGYYDEGSKEVKETNEGAKTNNDSDAAAINTSIVLTSVVNSMRDLYVEQLKYLAISNIEEIKKETLDDIAELDKTKDDETKDDKKDKKDEDKSSAEASNTVATAVVETPASVLSYKGKGVCERCIEKKTGNDNQGSEEGKDARDNYECKQEDCPEGTFPEPGEPDVFYVCKVKEGSGKDNKVVCERLSKKSTISVPLDEDGDPIYAEYLSDDYINKHPDKYEHICTSMKCILVNKKTGKTVEYRYEAVSLNTGKVIYYDRASGKQITAEEYEEGVAQARNYKGG